MREETFYACKDIEDALYSEFSWLFKDNYKYANMCRAVENNMNDVDTRFSVLERALLKACIEIGGTSRCGLIYDDLLGKAEKELKDGNID